jgi:hypothetical protein
MNKFVRDESKELKRDSSERKTPVSVSGEASGSINATP